MENDDGISKIRAYQRRLEQVEVNSGYLVMPGGMFNPFKAQDHLIIARQYRQLPGIKYML